MLREVADGRLQITAEGPTDGGEPHYRVVIRQEDKASFTIDLSYEFNKKAPCCMQYDICKLSPDLFRGASLSVTKRRGSQRTRLPLRFARREIVSGAKVVLVRSAAADIEFSAVSGASDIRLLDCREESPDQQKSFLLLWAGQLAQSGTLSYRVTVRPASLKLAEQFDGCLASVASPRPGGLFIVPQPKEVVLGKGYFNLSRDVSLVAGDGTLAAASELQQELTRLLGYQLPSCRSEQPTATERVVAIGEAKRNSVIKQLCTQDGLDPAALPAEGYYLTVTPTHVLICGADPSGTFWGVQSLLQLLERSPNGQLPTARIKDWPSLRWRGACITEPEALTDLSILKRYLRMLTRYKANTVILCHEPDRLKWRSHPEVGNPKGHSPADIAAATRFARERFLNVIPALSAKMGSQGECGSIYKAYPQVAAQIGQKDGFYCVSNPDSYRLLFDLYGELIDAYRPSYLHICHDEISSFGDSPRCCQGSAAETLAEDVNRLCDWLNTRGVKPIMWADMLLDYNRFPACITTGSNRYPGATDTHLAISRLPKNLILADWQYGALDDYPSLTYLEEKGFSVLATSIARPDNSYRLARSAVRYGALGLVGADWGFSHTLNPCLVDFLALEYGWSGGATPPESLPYDPIEMAAEALRPPVTEVRATFPLDISTAVNETTLDTAAGDGHGFLDLGPRFDLQPLGTGSRQLGGVTFDVGVTCIVVGSGCSPPLPRKAQINVGRQADGLALLWTMYSTEPTIWQVPVGTLTVFYQDGSHEAVCIKESLNITDFRTSGGLRNNPWGYFKGSEHLYGAHCGWNGMGTCGDELNLQVFEWINPHPEEKIARLELLATADNRVVKLALIAATGLQYRTAQTQAKGSNALGGTPQ
ncbi:MAG: beta-N-acetylhexosaminidase [Pseudomonadota bacterium]